MARGLSLSQLTSDLRDELRRANSAAAAPDATPHLHRTINHTYEVLYIEHPWPFLRKWFSLTLNAGQQYYDVPSGLDIVYVEKVKLKHNGLFIDIDRGIDLEDYSAFDPEADERSNPALKWDIRFTGSSEQIEVWPLPDSVSQSLRFFGPYQISKLVDNTDICRLDGELIVLFAAAEILKGEGNEGADAKLRLAQSLLQKHKIRSTSGAAGGFSVGNGRATNDRLNPRTTVRISGG